ncbi:MAG: hypothetical protein AB1918_07190 [Pseudomonadota bacterium]
MPYQHERSISLRLVGIGLAVTGLVVNPVSVAWFFGRPGLSPRMFVIVLVAELFAILLGLGMAGGRRLRVLSFQGLALAFPLGLVAAAEVALLVWPGVYAIEDMRHFSSWRIWPPEMGRDDRLVQAGSHRLYRPVDTGVVRINADGLRSPEPAAKAPGEWRIAVTGGSTAWGWRVADDETLAAHLQRVFHDHGLIHVTVFNFGIESAVLAEEVALLKAFRERYGIDEVIFYTGGNDGWAMFSKWTGYRPQSHKGVMSFLSQLSTVRAALALASPAVRLPGRPSVAAHSLFKSQVGGALAEAADYCRAGGLACDVMLQPWVHHKAPLHPRESALRDNSNRAFGPLGEFLDHHYSQYFVDATIPVHDLRHSLDGLDVPVFGDMIHVNGQGNARIAEEMFRSLRSSRAAAWGMR